MKRTCESCLKKPPTRRITVKGVAFHVCTTCAPAVRSARAA